MSTLTYAYEELFPMAVMSLATVGPESQPHAAAVYFVAVQALDQSSSTPPLPPWELYFFSDALSQHAHDTRLNSAAAVTIYAESQGWQDIRGLQMRGTIHLVPPGPDWGGAWEAYCEKFPFARQFEAVVAQNTLYAFSPSWIRLIDNRQSFGFKQEWQL
jgi:uncharacterized protein YhbP (UPF0306 family)